MMLIPVQKYVPKATTPRRARLTTIPATISKDICTHACAICTSRAIATRAQGAANSSGAIQDYTRRRKPDATSTIQVARNRERKRAQSTCGDMGVALPSPWPLWLWTATGAVIALVVVADVVAVVVVFFVAASELHLIHRALSDRLARQTRSNHTSSNSRNYR